MSIRRGAIATVALLAALGLALTPVEDAWGATIIDGPIGLGSAEPFGVLAGSTVTNTGPTLIGGDVGVSPGSAIDGFPPGLLSIGAAMHPADPVADEAQTDLTAAMVTAAGLTPTLSGLANLTGMTLVPGVYKGGALSLDGAGILTLDGDDTDVWVFDAASTLVTGSMSRIVFAGTASACNVFWRVGSSATFGTGTQFAGTVMAAQSITATTGTVVVGRLLAANAAVTLDDTEVVLPTDCTAPGTTSTTGTPVITSGSPAAATAGTPYAFSFTATGTPPAGYAVSSGNLPSGLVLDGVTGEISGTPVEAGTSTFTITAANGVLPTASVIARIVTTAAVVAAAPGLPATGSPSLDPLIPSSAIAAGLLLVVAATRRGTGSHRRAWQSRTESGRLESRV
jgi:hypothetical protein